MMGSASASPDESELLRARLAAIIEDSDDAILSKTLEGVINTWNRGAQRIFGYASAEVVGKHISLLIPPDRLDEETHILDRLKRGERVDHFETVRRHKNGQLIDVSLTVSPIKDASGRIVGASKIARDISDARRTRAQLASAAMENARLYEAEQQARAASEKANAAKDRFLAMLSHELRTPLTPVLALISDLGSDASLPARVTDALATMKRNVELEARLIDDLLDLTRVTQGKLELHLEWLTVGAITEAALATCIGELEAKGLTLVRALHDRDHSFRGDGARLTQILWNLLKNAIKFTPSGGTITVSAHVHPHEIQPHVIFEITDTGIGMEPSMIERLFVAFEQGGRNVTQQYGGLGLGLAISKALAEAHSGTLMATSEGKNKGSTFTLRIPVKAPQSDLDGATPRSNNAMIPSAALTSNGPNNPPRLLFVEDHGDTAKVLNGVLVRSGYHVILAKSVASALEVAAKEMETDGIDLVISDLGLPDGSGLELMSELSRRYGLRGIALSGYGMESDREASTAAGFVHHIIKPVDSTRLKAALSAFFQQA